MVTSVRDSARTVGMEESDEAMLDSRTRRMQASRLRLALFNLLQSDKKKTRQNSLYKIFKLARSYAHTSISISPSQTHFRMDGDENSNEENVNLSSSPESSEDDPNIAIPTVDHSLETEEAAEQLHLYLLTLLRLAVTCPYSDVRQQCKGFLNQVQATGIPVPTLLHPSPSFFIPETDITSFYTEAPTVLSTKMSPRSPVHFSTVTGQRENLSDDIGYNSTSNGDHWFHLKATNSDEDVIGQPIDEYLWQLLAQMFLTTGRITNLCRVLAYFPPYYESLHASFTLILKRSIGPLHPPWRYYLGIMAAAEHRCQYLVQLLTHDFIHYGGDKNWLSGLKYVPFKIRTISRLLLKLSRQPWRLEEDDIMQLMRHNSVGTPVSDTWTHSELVHALVIFASVLSLSSFVGACGIVCEPDMCGGYILEDKIRPGVEQELGTSQTQLVFPRVDEEEAVAAAGAATGWSENLPSRPSANVIQESSSTVNAGMGLKFQPKLPITQDEEETDGASESETRDRTNQLISMLKESTQTRSMSDSSGHCLRNTSIKDGDGSPIKVHSVRRLSEDSSSGSQPKLLSSVNLYVNAVYEDLDRFVDQAASVAIERREFDIKVDEELNLADFSWETEACDLVNHYLPSVGEYLDTEFHEALSITDWSIFNQQEDTLLDTSPLRRAIWFYCLKLYGARKEDYDYSDIARLVSPHMKKYLKKVCYEPQTVVSQDWKTIGISLRPEEKCHVNVLASEAKKQALLCCMLSMLARL